MNKEKFRLYQIQIEFLFVLQHFLETIVIELGWRGWDLNPFLAFTGLYNLLFEEKIQLYLTFLYVPQLERQGADLQTKIKELQQINQSLRENDKVKEDALADLSDQLLDLKIQ